MSITSLISVVTANQWLKDNVMLIVMEVVGLLFKGDKMEVFPSTEAG